MDYPGNLLELAQRIKICLYMGYPMWALQTMESDLTAPMEYLVSSFFTNLVPVIKATDPAEFGEGVYGVVIQSQIINVINDVASRTGSPKLGSLEVEKVLDALINGDWTSIGGDNDLAGGLPEYELRVKLLTMISQYTDAVIQQIDQFYFENESPKLAVPFVVDFPYEYLYPYGYGYGYSLSGYGYGYGYEGTDDYFEIIEQI